MIDLKKLKDLTSSLSVLYVEDSTVLVKRMHNFLERIFNKVYTATDGEKGLQIYKDKKPDLVITDLSMPVMDGHTMIVNLKQIDSEIPIIIMSAYSDTKNLLKSIHLGVSDFVPKPVDNKLFQNILFKVCSKIVKKTIALEKEELNSLNNTIDDNHDFLMKKLEIIHKSDIPIEFVNHYKGVPVSNKGKIVTMDNQSITVSAPYFQSLAIKYSKSTIILSELFDFPIECDLETVHDYNDTLVLNNIHLERNSDKKRKQLAIVPNDELNIAIKYDHQEVSHTINIISQDILEVFIPIDDLIFKESDELDLNISLDFIGEDNVRICKTFSAKGEVYSIAKNQSDMLVTILFQLDDLEKEFMTKYILKRRLDLIVEFKQLKKV